MALALMIWFLDFLALSIIHIELDAKGSTMCILTFVYEEPPVEQKLLIPMPCERNISSPSPNLLDGSSPP